MANTIEDVITRALLRLRETTGTAEFWSATELLSYANECYKFLALDGQLFKKTFIYEVKSGRRTYRLPDDTVGVRRIEFDNKEIHHSTPERWDGDNWNWRTDTGTVVEYTMELEDNTVFLYRIPDEDGTASSWNSEYGTVVAEGSDDTLDAEHGTVVANSGSFNTEYGVLVNLSSGDNNLRIYTYYIPADLMLWMLSSIP